MRDTLLAFTLALVVFVFYELLVVKQEVSDLQTVVIAHDDVIRG